MKKKLLLFIILALSFKHSGTAQSSCIQTQVSNNFEDGIPIPIGATDIFADDLIVSANVSNFELQTIITNIWVNGGVDVVNVTIYEDSGNEQPGAELMPTIQNIVPTTQVLLGSSTFGTEIYEVVIDLPVPIQLSGSGQEKLYWVSLQAAPINSGVAIFLGRTSVNPINKFTSRSINGEPWYDIGTTDGVISFSGECTEITGCLAPENIELSNITDDNSDVSWDDLPSAIEGFLVEVYIQGEDPMTATPLFSESLPAGSVMTTITGTEIGMSYDVYITANCGGGNFSIPQLITYMTSALPPSCGDEFYDTGGIGEDYSNNEDYSHLIQPDSPDNNVTITFSLVEIEEDYDILRVYDGDDATAPELSDPITGVTAPGEYSSSVSGGNLFVTFTSDASIDFAGWEAVITCEELLSNDSFLLSPKVTLHPNPASDFIILSLTEGLEIEGYSIYDFQGRKIIAVPSLENGKLDVSSLARGMYFLNMKTNAGVYIEKFILE
ncbi:T9SS type A sorting domain-containing protein [uncultured Lacinutrix sp.]|uniref:T9SS type A sorting domain-containing protein n=1 Tax=uncultured Lacinutrix sp. TaxID=574032 RepID=UPI00262B9DEA|nr:T9SS type A sorting domain-containing protein [uncultured Lacinutrix sp.]